MRVGRGGARHRSGGGAATVNETSEGIDGEPKLGAYETLAKARLGEDQARIYREAPAV